MSIQTEKIKELVEKRDQARLGGGQKAIDKQHARGKYTARERIEMLVDKDSFEEYDMFKLHRCHNFGMEKKQFLGDGVVAGSATIDGRLVYVYAQDFTVNGGSLSETMAQKICKVMDMAMQNGAPVICMNDSGGARIQEGISALAGYGEIFERNILASGVIPQISMILGPCAGGAVYSPALTDFILMTEGTSYMFLTGPKVVKTVTGEDIDSEHLGGASVHASKSGVTSFTAKTEEDAMDMIKKLLSYIPSNNTEEAHAWSAQTLLTVRQTCSMRFCLTTPTRHTTCTRSSLPLPTMANSLKYSLSSQRTSSLVSLASTVRAWASWQTSLQHTPACST